MEDKIILGPPGAQREFKAVDLLLFLFFHLHPTDQTIFLDQYAEWKAMKEVD